MEGEKPAERELDTTAVPLTDYNSPWHGEANAGQTDGRFLSFFRGRRLGTKRKTSAQVYDAPAARAGHAEASSVAPEKSTGFRDVGERTREKEVVR